MEIHPAAELFPMMAPEEFKEFKRDIKEHGLYEPITTYKGKILDGRNRYKACCELKKEGVKIEATFREWQNGQPDQSPTAYVLSANLHRRHLDTSQRAIIAVESLSLFETEARDRQIEAGKEGGKEGGRGKKKPSAPHGAKGKAIRSTAQAAKAVGVGSRTVDRAKQIKKAAPELAPKIKAGELSLADAGPISKLPKADQREAAVAVLENGFAASGKDAVAIVKTHDPDAKRLTESARAAPIKRDDRAEKWTRAVAKVGDLVDDIQNQGGARAIARLLGADLRVTFRGRLSSIGQTCRLWEKDLEDAEKITT